MTLIPKDPTAPVKPRKLTTGQRISQMMNTLQRLPREKATEELYRDVIKWTLEIEPVKRPQALVNAIASAFAKGLEEIDLELRSSDRRTEFDLLVPKSGWIHDYVEWTKQTEPPTVFHFFVAATTIGAALGRNVFFDKGAYQVFPNLCVMIVAPTGACRKTSACNVGVGIYTKTGGTVVGGDKPTPEALVDALKDQQNAVGLLYAPELAVFLGKQKYQEGMVPLLTALFDCPKEWSSKTVGGGERVLTNVALSALFCSTLDWIQTGIAKDAFGGGFMSRLLFVVQESTSRSFPLPPPLDDTIKKELVKRLAGLRNRKGPATFTADARAWYLHWYATRPGLVKEDRQYAGYYERKPDHLLRLAMILHVSEHVESKEPIILTSKDLADADHVLTWLEAWLPGTFDEMTASASGEDQVRLLRHLKVAGGGMEHSALLRKNSSKMNAEMFRRAMATLKEAKLVEYDAVARTYFLTTEGWQ